MSDEKKPVQAPAKEVKKVDSVYNDQEADVVITSSDDVDFRIHKYYLCAASTVFRDMARDCTVNGDTELQLTDTVLERSNILRLLLDLLCNKPFVTFDDIPCIDMLNLIRVARKYECAAVLQIISLHLTQPTNPKSNVFDRFYYACALDDVDAAHRFLPAAAALTWPDRGVPGKASVHSSTDGGSRLDVTTMSSVWIDQLPRKYFLALLRASSLRLARHGWDVVANEFKEQIKLQSNE